MAKLETKKARWKKISIVRKFWKVFVKVLPVWGRFAKILESFGKFFALKRTASLSAKQRRQISRPKAKVRNISQGHTL